jgi:flagellar biosynthetic protein FlhB
MVSLRSTVQLLKSMLEIAVIIWVITTGVRDMLPVVPDILNVDIGTSLAFMMNRTTAMVYKICLFFVAVAVMDFGYQRYEYEQKLMMTKQEIKDEYKQMEGDPLIRSRIRERQRKLSLNRMIQQVPEADVVVRNPTHYAVALKYRAEEDAAPLVVAKGQDSLARRILDVAEKNGVLIAENKPLAQSLYRNVDVNEYIPEEFFRPVAEILAWVYRQRKERRRA